MKLIADDKQLHRGFAELQRIIDLNAPVTVYAQKTRESGYCVRKTGDLTVRIDYAQRNTFFMALKEVLIGNFEATLTPTVARRGVMFDCARNAVMNVTTVKKYIAVLALTGYNYLELYVEDCLKVDGEASFGYMRGAYTKEEIKEIDAYAALFGMELTPCIQTLAHYNQLLCRPEYASICDKGDALLVGEKRTYTLIENILKTVSECFTSRNINIGMDEAMEVGRGRYYDKNGHADRHQLIVEHLKNVLALCRKYGFKPAMWSDMFFRAAFDGEYYVTEGNLPAEIIAEAPKDVQYIYWDYYHTDEKIYDHMLALHAQLDEKLCFAGGIWTWRGFAPYNEYTERTMRPALAACRRHNVQDIFMTLWGDNGGECARFSILSSVVFVAEEILCGKADADRVSAVTEVITGYTYEELKKLDLPNILADSGKVETNVNPSKYLLFADPLVSFFDDYVQDDFDRKYEKHYRALDELAARTSRYAYLFRTQADLCRVLMKKATIGVRLKRAYDNGSIRELKAVAADVLQCIADTQRFYETFCAQWDQENKPFGFEVQDIRIGGLIMRLKHVYNRIGDYVSGKIARIDELEEPRQTLKIGKHEHEVSVLFNDYRRTVTAGNLG